MIKKNILVFVVALTSLPVLSQTIISGKVIDAETKQPLSSAAVFLSNTSVGVLTGKDGEFLLTKIPSGNFKLVVSLTGYQTFAISFRSNNKTSEINIGLKTSISVLPDLVLEPLEKYGWEYYGQFFLDNFIGTSFYAGNCKLKNTEAVSFRKSIKKNTLSAYAREPLIIENEALGYSIRYQMEEFEYDYSNKLLVLNGYPLFTDLSEKNPSKAKKFEERRKDIYSGSVMHFMRAFFANKIKEEGFEMQSLSRVFNKQKARAKELFKRRVDTVIERVIDTIVTRKDNVIKKSYRVEDSTDLYKKALQQPDSVISHEVITGEQIGFKIDSATAGMYFPDSIQVTYFYKKIPVEYKRYAPQHRFDPYPVSVIRLINGKPLSILSNGFYYGSHDLKTTGFWAWSETMATLLPYDYWPPKE